MLALNTNQSINHISEFGKGFVSDRGKTTSSYKGKDSQPFDKWIFRNYRLVRDDDRRIFVTMTLT